MQKEAISLFISYAHDDDDYFRVFKEGLEKRLKHSSKFVWYIWTDQCILPGDLWHENIQDAAKKCNCALLLVSTGFMASDYVEKHELGQFLERFEKEDGLHIIPVMLAPCPFDKHPELKKRQIFYPLGKDYDKHHLKNITFADLTDFEKAVPKKNPNRERFLDAFVDALEASLLKKRASLLSSKPITPSPTPVIAVVSQPTYPDYIADKLENFIPPTSDIKDITRSFAEMRLIGKSLGPRTSESDLAQTIETVNKTVELLLREIDENIHETIRDSEHLKKGYVNVQFEDIVFRPSLGPDTQRMITRKRRHHSQVPWHERSLIVSALTLRLLHHFEEDIAYELLDFVRDKEPRVWKRAFTGLLVALLEHEEVVSQPVHKGLRYDIALLQRDSDVQAAFLEIERNLSSRNFEKDIEEQKTRVRFDEKFEFFQKMQHWFLPFYEGNPDAEEFIKDLEIRRFLYENIEWKPDALKYAFCRQYRSLNREERDSLLNSLRKTDQNIQIEYISLRNVYSGKKPVEAVSEHFEVKFYLKELHFFCRYYPDERFREMLVKKQVLYDSTLSDLLQSELLRAQIASLRFYFADKNEEAIPHFREVLRHQPESFYFLVSFARVLRKAGQFEEAINIFERALAIYPEDAWALENLAACYGDKRLENKDWGKCLFYLHSIESIYPGFVPNLRNIALCYEQKKDWENALKYRQRVIELESDNAGNWGSLGSTYEDSGDIDKGIENRLKAEQLDPSLVWNLRGLAWCYGQKKELETALKYRQRVIELEPENAGNWGMLGNTYKDSGNLDLAIEHRLKAEQLDPNLVSNLRGLASCYEQKKDWENALKYRQRVIELEPENAENWGTLGYTYEKSGDLDKGIESRLKAEQLDPNLVWNLRGLASCYEQKKDWETALKYRQRIVELEPENAGNWGMLGSTYEKAGDIDKGIENRLKAEQLAPNLVWNLRGLASCYEEKKDWERELKYRLRIVELEPDNANHWVEVAEVYLKLNKETKAEQNIKKAIKLAPDDSDVIHSIGWAYFVSQKIEKAKEQFLKSMDMGYENRNVYMNLGHIRLTEGDETSAQALWKEAFLKSEDVSALLKGFEDDFQYLEPHGVPNEKYWALIKAAQVAAGK